MAGNSNLDTLKWIIDSGATDHLISYSEHFHNKRMIGHIGQVQLPIEGSAIVSHMDHFQLNDEDNINDVLYVPTFKFYILSVNKLTMELNYCMSFFPTCCVFQDHLSGKVKGIADV